jgi:hypothetical protein
MSILKLTYPWVTAAALLVGCSSKQSTSSTNALGSEFTAAFRQAHDHRDLEAMSKLFCWDRVTPEIRKSTEDYLRGAFDDKIVDIKLTTEHPQGRPDVYVRNGITYRFNLPVVAELVVQNPPLPKEAFSGTYYPLGTRDGRYLIAQMAPVQGSEAQERPAPSGLPEQTSQPSQSGKTTEAAQPTVVPAETVLMVRLGEDLGLKTIKAGGKFSATVAQPVVVDGVIVIPAGSRVQGIVAKKGDYSPDVTLTSVTVNGRPQKISTGYMTFNEGVVFPAGSEMKFEFVFPLKLAE